MKAKIAEKIYKWGSRLYNWVLRVEFQRRYNLSDERMDMLRGRNTHVLEKLMDYEFGSTYREEEFKTKKEMRHLTNTSGIKITGGRCDQKTYAVKLSEDGSGYYISKYEN